MASYAYLIAPPGAATTLQGIFGAIFEGIGTSMSSTAARLFSHSLCLSLGTSIGSLLGGYVFQTYGGAAMFRSFGIYALLVGIAYSGANFFLDRRSSSRKGKGF